MKEDLGLTKIFVFCGLENVNLLDCNYACDYGHYDGLTQNIFLYCVFCVYLAIFHVFLHVHLSFLNNLHHVSMTLVIFHHGHICIIQLIFCIHLFQKLSKFLSCKSLEGTLII